MQASPRIEAAGLQTDWPGETTPADELRSVFSCRGVQTFMVSDTVNQAYSLCPHVMTPRPEKQFPPPSSFPQSTDRPRRGHGGEQMRLYNPVDGLLSTTEAAERLGVTATYIRHLAYMRDIPCQTVGRRMVFKTADLDRWASGRTARRAWQTIHNAEKQATR